MKKPISITEFKKRVANQNTFLFIISIYLFIIFYNLQEKYYTTIYMN